mmetsp:Transcript_29031/g.72400  ORF Transcript_29031/g.72400 Transcript_29031/m.72400 type:complete len:192 (-) Transcript_29031:22-597(-)
MKPQRNRHPVIGRQETGRQTERTKEKGKKKNRECSSSACRRIGPGPVVRSVPLRVIATATYQHVPPSVSESRSSQSSFTSSGGAQGNKMNTKNAIITIIAIIVIIMRSSAFLSSTPALPPAPVHLISRWTGTKHGGGEGEGEGGRGHQSRSLTIQSTQTDGRTHTSIRPRTAIKDQRAAKTPVLHTLIDTH